MLLENINNTLFFSIISFVYLIIVTIIFCKKKKIKSLEMNIFRLILIDNIVSLILEFLIIIVMNNSLLLLTVLKLFNISLLTYVFLFLIYTYTLVYHSENINLERPLFLVTLVSYLFFCLIILLLPVYFNDVAYFQYSYGPSVLSLFVFISIVITIIVIMILLNIKAIVKKKATPIILLIILMGINGFVQFLFPNILLANFIISLVTFTMYFTIENPDVKLISELEIAKEQADKANHAKTDFLSSMSHEIRTPLNAVVGFSQTLMDEDLTPTAKDQVKEIITASNNLLELVNGILDISKIEANKIEIIETEYSFKKIFDELVSLAKARLGDKQLDFRVSYDESVPKVLYGDKVRIKQVILNLLTNSIKYTKQGFVEFKVSSFIKDNICRLIVSVEDSGIGIKQENIEKLFTKFQRFDEKTNGTIEGTGLGLAITKKLVELMNGKIIVQSVYGEGSKFTISLDQRIILNPTIEVEESTPLVVNESFDLTGKRVLVVDDNKINLKVASKLLEKYNVIIETLDNGTDCINKIKAGERYDIILMDDMMPNKSGVETHAELVQIEGFNIPVVILTANALTGMREKYINDDGFDEYLAKPIEKAELNKILKKFLIK